MLQFLITALALAATPPARMYSPWLAKRSFFVAFLAVWGGCCVAYGLAVMMLVLVK